MFSFTEVSRNSKIGPMSVTTIGKQSCPDSCALKNVACYAETGYLSIHWNTITKGEKSLDKLTFINKIKNIPKGEVWRWAQAGDFPKVENEERPDLEFAKKIFKASSKTKPIAFSHWEDKKLFQLAHHMNFNLIKSLDKFEGNDYWYKNYPTSLTVNFKFSKTKEETITEYRKRISNDMKEFRKNSPTKIIMCPATYMDITCKRCQICTTLKKGETVVFPAHGVRKRNIK